MTFLLRTLSRSYFRQHRFQSLLTAVGIAAGVATYASISAAQSTLVDSLQTTVDRVAGRAQLQITGIGGVPEDLSDRVSEIPAVAAFAPVIQQVVQTGASDPPMSVLVLGVDLLGDRRMREYGFDGDDSEIDDPLEFLAQPDSIALTSTAAAEAGVRVGDRIELLVGSARKPMTVRALLRPSGLAGAFGGRVAITDVYAAQTLLGRERRFDWIDVRLRPGVAVAAGAEDISRALGPGYDVQTPERRGAEMDELIVAFVAAFDVSSLLALGMGVFVIFNVLTVAVDRRRRDIGILRALGATPRQIQRLFIAEALVLGSAGGALGLVLSYTLTRWFFGVMGNAVATAYNLETAGTAAIDTFTVAASLLLGLAASLIGAWLPARAAARVQPTQALAVGIFRVRERVRSTRAHALGLALLAFSVGVACAPLPGIVLMPVVLATGTVAVVILAGPIGRRLLERVSPLMARLAPVAGHLAADSVLSQPRRTASTTATVALSIAFVLGAGGYLNSTTEAWNRWLDDVLTDDLMVRASLRLAPGQQRLPARLNDVIQEDPAVRSIDAYRADWIRFRNRPALLVSVDTAAMLDRTRHDFRQGSAPQMRRGLIEEGECALSDNFARVHGLGVGDVITLNTPSGAAQLPVAAVVVSYVSDRGAIFIDRELLRKLWHDDAVDAFHVMLRDGVDPVQVRDRLMTRLSAHAPALISTRQELAAELNGALEGFYASTRLTILMALVVAFVGIATALFISVVERRREIGIMKALGAARSQIGGVVVMEAVEVSLCGGVIAVPIGALVAQFLETIVAEAYAGFEVPHAYPTRLLVQVFVALPLLAAAAAWLPARQAVRLNVTDAIANE
jgi:putative ABC transport system permease protein